MPWGALFDWTLWYLFFKELWFIPTLPLLFGLIVGFKLGRYYEKRRIDNRLGFKSRL